LLLLVSRLATTVSKKSTLFRASFSFISSSTAFAASPSTSDSDASSLLLIRIFANSGSFANFVPKLEPLWTLGFLGFGH
jgi:hypothetical protein